MRPRSGTLTDEATLRAVEAGEHVTAVAAREGCTSTAIRARMTRAKRARGEAVQASVFAGLNAAIERLARVEAGRR